MKNYALIWQNTEGSFFLKNDEKSNQLKALKRILFQQLRIVLKLNTEALFFIPCPRFLL